MNIKTASTLLILLTASLITLPAKSEPYIAVMKGMKCMACHTNPTGGGKRNVYGNMFSQYEFSNTLLEDFINNDTSDASQTDNVDENKQDPEIWNGDLGHFVSVGGDLRVDMNATETPNQNDEFNFELNETLIYLEIKLIQDRFSFYIDERVAPGAAINRESYGLFWLDNKKYYIKAGKFFLPYGLRIEDDFAFIRQETNINYFISESGIETGIELGNWSGSFSLTEGEGLGTGKRYSLLFSYIEPAWRIGSSVNYNVADAGDIIMANIFAGLNTGPVTWLSEIDFINDDELSVDKNIGFLEANISIWKGHNLKFTLEYYDPDLDVSKDEQTRNSIVWEYMLDRFVQTRLGVRVKNGIDAIDSQNTDELFAQLHMYF